MGTGDGFAGLHAIERHPPRRRFRDGALSLQRAITFALPIFYGRGHAVADEADRGSKVHVRYN